MRLHFAPVLGVLLLLCSQGSPSPGPTQDPKDGNKGFKLGVVNLRQCFDKTRYERMKDAVGELDREYKNLMDDLQATQKKIIDLKGQIDELKSTMSGTSIYYDKLRTMKLAEMELETKKKFGEQLYRNREIELYVKIHDEVRGVVRTYGKDHGYDLILRAEGPQLSQDEDLGTAWQRIQNPLLYNAEGGIDITEEILKLLNAEYLRQKSASQSWDCPKCKVKITGASCAKCGTKKP